MRRIRPSVFFVVVVIVVVFIARVRGASKRAARPNSAAAPPPNVGSAVVRDAVISVAREAASPRRAAARATPGCVFVFPGAGDLISTAGKSKSTAKFAKENFKTFHFVATIQLYSDRTEDKRDSYTSSIPLLRVNEGTWNVPMVVIEIQPIRIVVRGKKLNPGNAPGSQRDVFSGWLTPKTKTKLAITYSYRSETAVDVEILINGKSESYGSAFIDNVGSHYNMFVEKPFFYLGRNRHALLAFRGIVSKMRFWMNANDLKTDVLKEDKPFRPEKLLLDDPPTYEFETGGKSKCIDAASAENLMKAPAPAPPPPPGAPPRQLRVADDAAGGGTTEAPVLVKEQEELAKEWKEEEGEDDVEMKRERKEEEEMLNAKQPSSSACDFKCVGGIAFGVAVFFVVIIVVFVVVSCKKSSAAEASAEEAEARQPEKPRLRTRNRNEMETEVVEDKSWCAWMDEEYEDGRGGRGGGRSRGGRGGGIWRYGGGSGSSRFSRPGSSRFSRPRNENWNRGSCGSCGSLGVGGEVCGVCGGVVGGGGCFSQELRCGSVADSQSSSRRWQECLWQKGAEDFNSNRRNSPSDSDEPFTQRLTSGKREPKAVRAEAFRDGAGKAEAVRSEAVRAEAVRGGAVRAEAVRGGAVLARENIEESKRGGGKETPDVKRRQKPDINRRQSVESVEMDRGRMRRRQTDRGRSREEETDRGMRKERETDRGMRKEGETDRGMRKEGETDRGMRKEGETDRGMRKEGETERGIRKEGETDRGMRKEGETDRGIRKEGETDRGKLARREEKVEKVVEFSGRTEERETDRGSTIVQETDRGRSIVQETDMAESDKCCSDEEESASLKSVGLQTDK